VRERIEEMKFQASLHGVDPDKLDIEEDYEGGIEEGGVPPPPLSLFKKKEYHVDEKGRKWPINKRLRMFAAELGLVGESVSQSSIIEAVKVIQREKGT